MDRVFAQCQKELAQFQRDRLAAGLAFILPVITLLIFGFAIRLEIKDVPLLVVDYEQSSISQSYVDQVFATRQFYPVPNTRANPIQVIDDGQAKAALVIPSSFSRDIQSGQTSDVQVLLDGMDVNNARVIRNTIRAVTQSFVAQSSQLSQLPQTAQTSQGYPSGPKRIPQVVAQVRIWFNPGRREGLYIVPGVYAIVLFTYPAVLATMAFVVEKEQKTFIQVCASGLTAAEFLLGKCLSYLVVAIAQAILLMSIGAGLFDVWLVGNPLFLMMGTILYLLVSILFGLLMGVWAKQALVAIQNVMNTGLLAAVWLSGFIYPVENIPFPLSILSWFVPARYYIELTRDAFLVGEGWPRIWMVCPVLAGMGSTLFFLAWFHLRHMQVET